MTHASRKGSILIVVLFVMTTLSLLAVSMAYATSLRARWARDRSVMVRLQAQTRSAVAIAIARIEANKESFDHPAQHWSAHERLGAEGWLEDWSSAAGEAGVRFDADYQVIDEEGKLNLLFASDDSLMRVGMSKEQIASLRDWMDGDDIAQSGGAEREFYLSKEAPYLAKNMPIEMLDELLLVRGFDTVNYYGPRRHWGAEAMPESVPESTGQRAPGWVDLLTVSGSGKINLNTAPRVVLATLPLSRGGVDALIEFRSRGIRAPTDEIKNYAMRSQHDIEQLQGLSNADRHVLEGIALFRSSYFRIFAYALDRSTGLSCRCEVLVRRGESGCKILHWKPG